MQCPNCKFAPVPDGATVCPNCGQPLADGATAALRVSVTQDVRRVQGEARIVGVEVGEVKGDLYSGYSADEVKGLLAQVGATVPAHPTEGDVPLPPALDAHYKLIVKAITDGRLVPFLGAGANLCGRPATADWRRDHFVPSSDELATHLADNFGYPANEQRDLQRVSQYVATMSGSGPLYEELRTLYDNDYPPTPLHQFLAALPAALRAKGYPPRYQLIVTTNYDDLLERAFRATNEPFDLVMYVAEGEHRGKFVHWTPGGDAQLIEKPNEYRGLSLDTRSVILKIHGAVDRATALWDSFVITEDHYIEYLTRTDISNLLPVTLAAKLKKSHFLFMGYSLHDWNLRVILHRIWGEQKLTYKSWAVQQQAEALEQEFWRKRDVDILNLHLEDYVAVLAQRINALPNVGGTP